MSLLITVSVCCHMICICKLPVSYINVIKLLVFRGIKSPNDVRVVIFPWEKSQQQAALRMKLMRSIRQQHHHTLLFRPGVGTKWGSDKQVQKNQEGKTISPFSLARSLSTRVPKWSSDYRDQDFMTSFLARSKLDALVYNEKFEAQDILPNRCSLLDYIAADSQRNDVWVTSQDDHPRQMFEEFQRTKGLGYELLELVEVREIIVSVTPEEEVETIRKWYYDRYKRDQDRCPTGTLSMDIEEVKILEQDYHEILKKSRSSDNSDIILSRIFKDGDKCKQFPVKVMLGNGYSWALMISIVITPSSSNPGSQFSMSPVRFQENLLKLLRTLPMLIGVGIRSDVAELVELVREIADPTFTAPMFFDLSALAVLCGYNFKYFNMQALAVQLFGACLNKSVSIGDHKWGYKWERIPMSLRIYCIGDVKFGHQAVVLLLTILLRQMFPDPDVALSFCRSDAATFTSWFFTWIRYSLMGVEVEHTVLSGAMSHRDLLFALRVRHGDGSLSNQPPARVETIGAMFGPWPSIVNGGCRYLHQARRVFWDQVRLLKESEVLDWDRLMPFDLDDEMREAATYGLSGLNDLDYEVGTSLECGLAVHPKLISRGITEIPVEELSFAVINQQGEDQCRIKREMCYEYCRVNLDKLKSFFEIVLRDRAEFKFVRSYYCEPRMIYLRCTGVEGPRQSPFHEELRVQASRANKSEEKLITSLKAKIEVLSTRLAVRRDRLELFRHREKEEGMKPCSISWRGQVPAVALSKGGNMKKGSRKDTESRNYIAEAIGEDAQPLPECRYLLREPSEARGTGGPPSKRRKKSKGRPCMGEPGFTDYDICLDLSSEGYEFDF